MVVSRADVARRAGVSPALVSYVTNGGPRPVSAAARARIEQAIDELGYTPNTIAQALRGSSTQTVALLVPSAVNGFFGELATAIEEQLYATGNSLAVGITNDEEEREMRYIESFAARQVDGIMAISSNSENTLGLLSRSTVPAIILDRIHHGLDLSSVTIDNRAAAHSVVQHLLEHGHSIVACVGGRIGTSSADERVDGWREATSTGAGDDRYLARADFTEIGGYEATRALLEREGTPPTALFVSSDVQAVGAIRACAERGLRVPDDLAIASIDGTVAASFMTPSLTSYRQPIEKIAETAVGLLLAMTGDEGDAHSHLTIGGDLVLGGSCGCPEHPISASGG
ncbi:LacI family transcriptional regulator [Agromyces atrinae]|uniref:LacI family DNA-binding transcriptional regulator n=1 Tax=Agromyces atrinae TaxID=592376 RepID=UPI001F59BCF4|nr:LacI family DNA-binding transcriptional regulator [Agromyces atrinae]MCI2958723.1 LacI family transcriptional regulator [Agromyces atrinae]